MTSLPFSPPPVNITRELRWVLLRAFGPVPAPWSDPVDPAAVEHLASRFSLVSRIAGRRGKRLLEEELGEETARKWLHTLRLTAASVLRFQAVARQLAETANGAGIPVTFLKGTALGLGSLVPLGFRGSGDIDMLVPPGRVAEMGKILKAQGAVPSELPNDDDHQHLPPVYLKSGVMLEIHRHLPGVRLRGRRRSVTIGDLEDEGLLVPVPEIGARAFIPAKPVLVAHCLVHGLVQHGAAPGSYPGFRIFADLADLGCHEASWNHDERLTLARLDDEALSEIRFLVGELVKGNVDELLSEEGAASRVLRHYIAGSTDQTYCEALKAHPRYMMGLSEKPRPLALISNITKTVFITRAQVDAIYGRPGSPWGYAARQVLRPFDLACRAVRYATAAVRVKSRGRA